MRHSAPSYTQCVRGGLIKKSGVITGEVAHMVKAVCARQGGHGSYGALWIEQEVVDGDQSSIFDVLHNGDIKRFTKGYLQSALACTCYLRQGFHSQW